MGGREGRVGRMEKSSQDEKIRWVLNIIEREEVVHVPLIQIT